MSLADHEVDALLNQLIEQTLPDRPSDDEAQRVVRWGENARMSQELLAMVLAGDVTVRVGPDKVAMFKLTEQGRANVRELLQQSPAAREYLDQLIAGDRLMKGPEGQQ